MKQPIERFKLLRESSNATIFIKIQNKINNLLIQWNSSEPKLNMKFFNIL